ncbi:MAG: hypothetical protein GQ527_06465 [Bacteroidales bacterium]|nr:hypothetical protein [Bacteroidales bacterium]
MYTDQKNDFVIGLMYQKLMHKYITAYGYVRTEDDYWMLMVQKGFLEQKLNISLGYFLHLDLGVSYEQGYYTTINNYYSEKTSNIDILKNFVMISISYNFNKGKTTRKIKKKVKEEKEIKANESIRIIGISTCHVLRKILFNLKTSYYFKYLCKSCKTTSP